MNNTKDRDPKRTKKSYEGQAPVAEGYWHRGDPIALPRKELLRRQREQGKIR